MNISALRSYIVRYKQSFNDISQREIYKWQAVRVFQTEWDLNTNDFPSMLERALSRTDNLMNAGNYFPRGMIINLAKGSPEDVRDSFRKLFDENNPLLDRVRVFRDEMKNLNEKLGIGKNTYQDHRAVLVYLCMRYPESYFLYKFGMLKEACRLLEIDYIPRIGADENIIQYLHLCEIVRSEIAEDYELLSLHYGRLSEQEYPDNTHTILTQDIVYAVTEYLEESTELANPIGALQVSVAPQHKPAPPLKFSPSFVDFVGQERRNRRIGMLGELLVLQWEIEKHGKENVSHVSQVEGDGAGYDIRSTTDDGDPLYIEVKTTTSGITTPFEVTRHELEWSRTHSSNCQLHRLYNFNPTENQADLYVITGSLEQYCDCAMKYRVYWSAAPKH
jgi:hypothetical protein